MRRPGVCVRVPFSFHIGAIDQIQVLHCILSPGLSLRRVHRLCVGGGLVDSTTLEPNRTISSTTNELNCCLFIIFIQKERMTSIFFSFFVCKTLLSSTLTPPTELSGTKVLTAQTEMSVKGLTQARSLGTTALLGCVIECGHLASRFITSKPKKMFMSPVSTIK